MEEGQYRTLMIIDGAQQAPISSLFTAITLCVYVVAYDFLHHNAIIQANIIIWIGGADTIDCTEMSFHHLSTSTSTSRCFFFFQVKNFAVEYFFSLQIVTK